ncbi:Signal transduction histidine kinase [Catenovulum agarivorans DS-2]|uniref:histidine kinase n=1 Tax=Catenovulum agarivorans DS-2 TaxID=1328313 RepID=W7QWV8_9ALTE|nr:ATP-binding protein [Catenovulum agarivorans]EWH09755.1 Signal transduction histidine kinase [Catenovulum agarivorans DS-2]
MKQLSISRKLLTKVLTIYILLTVIVTAVQVVSEYYITKSHIEDELKTLQKTFSGSLTRAIWELNVQQSVTIAQGLLAMPSIEGIILRDENGQVISKLGDAITLEDLDINYDKDSVLINKNPQGLFGYIYPLIFEFSGRPIQVGDVTLISSRDIIIERIKIPLFLLMFKAVFITLSLFLIIWVTFRKLLSRPLYELTEQIEDFDIERLSKSKINLQQAEHNELSVLEDAYNGLIDRLIEYNEELETAHNRLIEANSKLDDQNLMLEQEVARKTANLSRVMLDLEEQKKELEGSRNELRQGIETRKRAEQALLTKQKELEASLNELKSAQGQLVESEKMASLGGLVAGIAHDVNTPIGVSVTASSYLTEQVKLLNRHFEDKTLTPKHLQKFLNDANESIALITSNLKRASDLVASFKQIAVDQASEAIRDIELNYYVHDIIKSLNPQLKKTQHQINVSCPDKLDMRCPAGAISQIFTNLIMNSVIHGFERIKQGRIDIKIEDLGDEIKIDYQDNGKGVTQEVLNKLFDPFFTTKREKGGSGLGTHITYNLVRQTLNGTISASSELGKGLHYTITIPKVTEMQAFA